MMLFTEMSHYYVAFTALLTISLAEVLHNKYVVKRATGSAFGKYLRGHVYKITKEAIDPQHCMADCWAENDRCQSFNYFPNWDICELNEASNLTNPEDLIDRPDTVYVTNPIHGREPKPDMARHTNYDPPDACASNPCTNAESCVNDLLLGYRCQNCHSHYTGPKCDEHLDPCASNPCLYGGTCISTMMRWRCACPFPFWGLTCAQVVRAYDFHLNGTGDYYPYASVTGRPFTKFTLTFWFKTTEQNRSYFIHKIPKYSPTERLTVWRDRNTFFVQLWKDHVYNFSFPRSYPVNDNNWHVVAIVLKKTAELLFYLDGARRDPPKLTIGVPNSKYPYNFRTGTLYLGYYKDSNEQEYFYNGSIGKVEMGGIADDDGYFSINNQIVLRCRRENPYKYLSLGHTKWAGMDHHAKQVDCVARAPIMGIRAYQFPSTATSQWLEQAVSPPRDLTAFTMIFQIMTKMHFDKPVQIACYGDQGDDCRLSVVINVNYTLEMIIGSTRFLVDLIPLNDNHKHYVVIKWTNDGGVFELIINGVLQSTRTGIKVNGKISGQNRFMVGSSVPDKRTLDGYINNLNVWDEIISDEMLYLMILEPGNDMGNVVAWRDFTRPSSIPEEQFVISKHTENFRTQTIGRNNFELSFSQPFPAYIHTLAGCCWSKFGLTIAMWLKLKVLPANLVRLYMPEKTNPDIALKISSNGNITFSLKGETISLGSWPADASGIHADKCYNYLAFSWSNDANLHFILNGVEKHVSSRFGKGFYYKLENRPPHSGWIFGERENISGIVGSVAQLNMWLHAKPLPALRAMSRGISAIGSNVVSLEYLKDWVKGNVEEVKGNEYYLPDVIVQKKRDQYCNDALEGCIGKSRARVGTYLTYGVRWGCFCEENLSEDMNFNNGVGDYSVRWDLPTIN